MTALFSVFIYFLSFFLIKLLNFHLRRRETLRVVRLLDPRYFVKGLLLKIRDYVLSSNPLRNDILSFFILFFQFLILYENVSFLYQGTNVNAIFISFCFLSVLVAFSLLLRAKEQQNIRLLDNHLILHILFLIFICFLPDLNESLSGFWSPLFSIILLVLSVVISYQTYGFIKAFISLSFQPLYSIMYVYLILTTLVAQVYSHMEPGTLRLIIVMLHAILFTAILLSFYLNTVEIKSREKNRRYAYSVSVFCFFIFVFIWGGLSWQ